MFIRLERQNSPAAPAIPTLIHHTQAPKGITRAKDLPLIPNRVASLSHTPSSLHATWAVQGRPWQALSHAPALSLPIS